MGRPRKPLDQLAPGSYRPSRHADRLPAAVPVATSGSPLPSPPRLTGEGAQTWNMFARLLVGIATERDGPMLEQLCFWWGLEKRIWEKVDGLEPGTKAHLKMLVCAGIASDKVTRLAGKFGLTPLDRQKLRLPSGPPIARVPTRPLTALDRLGLNPPPQASS